MRKLFFLFLFGVLACALSVSWFDNLVKSPLPIKEKIVVLEIGCIIASHCNKGTVAVSFLGSKRV